MIEARVTQLYSELRSQVQSRSYGARSKLIVAPLKELDLDITPRVGWVRDPRLVEPEPISEKTLGNIVAAFESSKRRLLIVGEPGSGKTTAAYALIAHLDQTEGDERIPLLVNLSAWEAQDNFEAFLTDYLVSEVGYQVREPTVAHAFVRSRRYNLVLDGLDEIPAGLRRHFSERLDEFAQDLPSAVAVVATCRTREYEELRTVHHAGLGLVQAVEILPLSSQQLDRAFVELAKFDDKDWGSFLSQRYLRPVQRARNLLSNPLFLNLAVTGHLHPRELLNYDEEQELRDLVLERYFERVIADQSKHDPKDVRRYLTWIARFLNGAEVSPFGLKTTDATVFDLADLTPPDPPKRYRFFETLVFGLIAGLVVGLNNALLAPLDYLFSGLSYGILMGSIVGVLVEGLVSGLGWGLGWGLLANGLFLFGLKLGLVNGPVYEYGLVYGLTFGLVYGLIVGLGWGLVFGLLGKLLRGLLRGRPYERAAARSRLTLAWPSTQQQRRDLLGRAGRGLVLGLVFGLVWLGLGLFTQEKRVEGVFDAALPLALALFGGLLGGMGFGLVETRPVLITSRTPKEANSRSLIAALVWLGLGLGFGLLVVGLGFEQLVGASSVRGGLGLGLGLGLVSGTILSLRNGGRFVLLQRVAHRRLSKAGNLPPHPAGFLEWGIERQIFRRVGGGVRFRHGLLQQHLANTSVGELT